MKHDHDGDDNEAQNFAEAIMTRASTALSGRARAWLNMRDDILTRLVTARAMAATHPSTVTGDTLGADVRYAEKIATRMYPGGERLAAVYDSRVGAIFKDVKHIVESHHEECENHDTCMADEEGALLLADFEAIFGPKKDVQ
jgi:hypothetical protein